MKQPTTDRAGIKALEAYFQQIDLHWIRHDRDVCDTHRQRWLQLFANAYYEKEATLDPNYLLWHTFSSGATKAVGGMAAVEQFTSCITDTRYLFFCRPSLGLFEFPDARSLTITDVGQICSLYWKFADSIWLPNDFGWTYVTTHEEDGSLGIGPFYSRTAWIK